MKKLLAFYFFIFLISAGVLFAETPEELYIKANSDYENGDYEKAISSYEELLDMNKVSLEVFYNLGNVYFKSKKIGKAILNYERALRMAPRDSDIQLNLRLTRAMAIDKINTQERGFILDAALFLYDRMNINELTVTCSILYFFIIMLLVFSIFFVAKRRKIFYTASVFGIILFIFFAFLLAKVHSENFVKSGIVITENIDVRSGPKEDYLLQFTLHEGTKVSIIKETQGWYEIELSRDLKGWIPKTSVAII